MIEVLMCYTHAMEGCYPELEEIIAHIKMPENVEALNHWTYICFQATKENWPDFVRKLWKERNVPEEIPVKNEESIKALIAKMKNERTWTIKRLV